MFQTPYQEFEEAEIIYGRSKKHWDEIQNSFPAHLENFTLLMTDIGKGLIRAFIECPKDVSEKETKDAMKWMKSISHKIERIFREDQGTFTWIAKVELEDSIGKYEYMILLEKCNPMNCEVKVVTKTMNVYESVCK